jgi:hypothetical protein
VEVSDLAESSDKTLKRRGPGKPFAPGQSGNPGGRPAVVRDFRQRCRDFMESGGWQNLIDLANTSGDKDQLRALELIASYAYGKPKQGVELTGEDGAPLNVGVVILPSVKPDDKHE